MSYNVTIDNFFERLKRINNVSNLTVYGYLREHEKNLFGELIESDPFYNFPELMHKICLVYYAMIDEWDPEYIGTFHELSKNGLCIENTTNAQFCSSYGKIIAKSPGIYRWRLKLNHLQVLQYSYWTVILGVWKVKSAVKPVTDSHFASTANGQGK